MSSPTQETSRRFNLSLLLKGLCLAFLFGSFELIIFSPLVVLSNIYVTDAHLWQTCLQFLLCFVIGCYLGRIRWLTRTLYELMVCALVGFTMACLLQGNNWQGWVCSAIGLLLVYRGIRSAKGGWLSLFPVPAFVTSGLVYFVGVPLMGRIDLFQPYMSWMNGFGFCTLIIFFFVMNRAQLLSATLASTENAATSALSETVKRSGRIWLITLIACIGVVAYFQQLQQGIVTLLRASIAWLLHLLQSEQSPEAPPLPSPEAQPPLLPPPAPAGEPSWLDILFHYVQVIVGYLIVIALIVGAIYVILSKLTPALVSLLRRLMNRSLSSRHGDGAEGFTDEKETLLAWKRLPRIWWQQAMKSRSKERGHKKKWIHLPNNRERIRFLYRLLIQQAAIDGYTFNKTMTPNETEKDLKNKGQLPHHTIHAITSAYNEVRYGDDEISDLQLDQVLQAVDPSIRNQLK